MNERCTATGDGLLARIGWWILFAVVVVYGLFSIQMGISELAFLLGLRPEIKHRAAPVVFVVHALAGTSLPPGISYPLSLMLATSLNLTAAEIWIRRHRARRGAPTHAGTLAVA